MGAATVAAMGEQWKQGRAAMAAAMAAATGSDGGSNGGIEEQ